MSEIASFIAGAVFSLVVVATGWAIVEVKSVENWKR